MGDTHARDIPDDLQTVEMQHAFFWVCPSCGERNWCEAVANEDPTSAAAYEDQIEIDTHEVLVLRTPRKVCCLKCSAWWGTEYPRALEPPEGSPG